MLKRNITITPAFDYILNDTKNAKYGRGDANITFEVIGDEGAITLSAFTKWFLPETIKAIPDIANGSAKSRILNIHSKKEFPDDKEALFLSYREDCKCTKGKCYCYNVYSCSYEQELIDLMIREGSDKLFEKLEEIYDEVFENDN